METKSLLLCICMCWQTTGCKAVSYNKGQLSCKIYEVLTGPVTVGGTHLWARRDECINLPYTCGAVDITTPIFTMDERNLYNTYYLSKDRQTIFNRPQPLPGGSIDDGMTYAYNWPPPANIFNNYQGTKATVKVLPGQRIYFEFIVYYSIDSSFSARQLIFEVGVSPESIIDNSYHVGYQSTAFSVAAHRMYEDGYVHLNFRGNTVVLYTDWTITSASTAGTSHNLTLGMYVDAPTSKVRVVDLKRDVLLYTFTGVSVPNVGVYPVFALYGTPKADVRLRIRTGCDINSIPCKHLV